MWNTSFSDFAKRAQEASELAAKKAQEASTSMNAIKESTSGFTSMFNLDNMLDQSNSHDVDTHNNDTKMTTIHDDNDNNNGWDDEDDNALFNDENDHLFTVENNADNNNNINPKSTNNDVVISVVQENETKNIVTTNENSNHIEEEKIIIKSNDGNDINDSNSFITNNHETIDHSQIDDDHSEPNITEQDKSIISDQKIEQNIETEIVHKETSRMDELHESEIHSDNNRSIQNNNVQNTVSLPKNDMMIHDSVENNGTTACDNDVVSNNNDHDELISIPASPDRSINKPLSRSDEENMNYSMSKSVEVCDSERSFVDTDEQKINDEDVFGGENDHFNTMYDENEVKKEKEILETSPIHTSLSHSKYDNYEINKESLQETNICDSLPVVERNKEDNTEENKEVDTIKNNNPNILPSLLINDPSESNISPTQQVPQFAMEKFMLQLERLHEQHESELQEMERKHQIHMSEMKVKLEKVTVSDQSPKNAMAEQDKYLSQLRKLEKEFNGKLEKKDEQITDLVDINKLMEEQIEELKSEADGLNKSLNARNEMIAQMQQKDSEIETLKTELDKTKKDLDSSNEAFATLKGRVKVVATELKDRRVECRTLNVTVQELTLFKSNLETENKELSSKLSKVEKSNQERGIEIESLQKFVSDLKLDVKMKEKELVEKGTVGDQALSAYKKKAQSLLANANARAAAANQARDDAESDAINAREEAHKAIKAARDAEEEKDRMVKQSYKDVDRLQKEVDTLTSDRNNLSNDLESTKKECLKALDDIKESQRNREDLLNELNAKDDELEKEIEKNSGLEQDIAMFRIRTSELENEIVELKNDLEKAKTATFMALQKESIEDKQSSPSNGTFVTSTQMTNDDSNSDSIIVMLQQELEVANDVIDELKVSLNEALSKDPHSPSKYNHNNNSSSPPSPHHHHYHQHGNQSKNDAVPLFFAFEKQAELNTARDEITRLAALLGDAESEKSEAYEAKEEMRKKMEEAESRLRRYEKLGGIGGGINGINGGSANKFGKRGGTGMMNNNSNPNHSIGGNSSTIMTGKAASSNESSVNIEYLKNIMLRYMNAMSLNEKKALIPVIGAVLELTADEQAQAMDNLGKNAGIQGVGTTLIENVQNRGLVSGLFGDLMS